jgi:hypothetical protein
LFFLVAARFLVVAAFIQRLALWPRTKAAISKYCVQGL